MDSWCHDNNCREEADGKTLRHLVSRNAKYRRGSCRLASCSLQLNLYTRFLLYSAAAQ